MLLHVVNKTCGLRNKRLFLEPCFKKNLGTAPAAATESQTPRCFTNQPFLRSYGKRKRKKKKPFSFCTQFTGTENRSTSALDPIPAATSIPHHQRGSRNRPAKLRKGQLASSSKAKKKDLIGKCQDIGMPKFEYGHFHQQNIFRVEN